jgi:hypothetical protein
MSFDLRLPIGIMFSFYGVLLVLYGLLSDKAQYTRSLGININRIWGMVLLVFGTWMWLMSQKVTRKPGSKFLFWVCFVQAALALYASSFWYESLTSSTEGLVRMVFASAVVPFLGGGTICFGFIPSAVLYFRRRQPLDIISLFMSCITIGVIAIEGAFVLWRGH